MSKLFNISSTGAICGIIFVVSLIFPGHYADAQVRYQNTSRVSNDTITSVKPSSVEQAGNMVYDNKEKVETYEEVTERRPTPALIAMRKEAAEKAAAEKAFQEHLDSVINIPFDIAEVNFPLLPDYVFAPAVFNHFEFPDKFTINEQDEMPVEALRWLYDENNLARRIANLRYDLFFGYPQDVRYNVSMLPAAPKKYHTVLNPEDFTIVIEPIAEAPVSDTNIKAEEVDKRHWIHSLNTLLQFSQAYVSPNWYQGGNNNINGIGQIIFDVKLNKNYHPNLLFDTTVKYKVAVNSAPDDSIHNYNITEDIFQVNSTFGLKAAKNWYYSFTVQFKTQLLQSYTSNTRNLRSAFMSPGELTAGIGMTYNRQNEKKTFNLDVSIAPISYNLRTCISPKMNPENFSISPGHKAEHNFGSTIELKLWWKLASNIQLTTRVFAFTDYDLVQADWENTIDFFINKFLTSSIYTHLRYDNHTVYDAGSKWKKLQFKELLTIGFSYKFSSF